MSYGPFSRRLITLFIIPVIIFVFFVFAYTEAKKELPIQILDEYLWIGRSYFFEFYTSGDFNNDIWKTYQSYDQPKLAELLYGAWLYPLYLKEYNYQLQPHGYLKFLVKNQIYDLDREYVTRYSNEISEPYVTGTDFTTEKTGIDYGSITPESRNIILYARGLNVFLLAGVTVTAYLIALNFGGLLFSVIISIIYGSNTLLAWSGLHAHSEALFLLTFNTSLLFLIIFFKNGEKHFSILLFTVFTGLCISTKLNGAILLIIYTTAVVFTNKKKFKLKYFAEIISPIIFSLLIFIVLNPFTFSNPYNNVRFLFEHRRNTASIQAQFYIKSFLPTPVDRLSSIYNRFFFSDKNFYCNNLVISPSDNDNKIYGWFLFIAFLTGIITAIKKGYIEKGDVGYKLLVMSYILINISMLVYLTLDWARYYVPLILYIDMFQMIGLFIIFGTVYKYLIRLMKTS